MDKQTIQELILHKEAELSKLRTNSDMPTLDALGDLYNLEAGKHNEAKRLYSYWLKQQPDGTLERIKFRDTSQGQFVEQQITNYMTQMGNAERRLGKIARERNPVAAKIRQAQGNIERLEKELKKLHKKLKKLKKHERKMVKLERKASQAEHERSEKLLAGIKAMTSSDVKT